MLKVPRNSKKKNQEISLKKEKITGKEKKKREKKERKKVKRKSKISCLVFGHRKT